MYRRTAAILAVLLGSLILATPAVEAAIGKTPGNFAVSSTGAATYSIPIWTPPGPKGVQPSLALVYSSGSGDGYLGVGWSVAGLSAISRCNKTYAQDTSPAPVTLTYSDAFCMDGKRLRITGGTYGYAGSTYQTEIADFSNVTAVGASGNGPASFTVQAKSGLTYEYGNGGNSRVLATGTSTASAWMLNKVTDRAGNSMVISYRAPDANLSGSTVPDTISWTPSSSGSTSYNYTVQFGYGANTPSSSTYAYVAGTQVVNSDLMTSVSVSSAGSVVRKYFIAYNTSPTTSAYRLSAVTECSDAAGTSCLSPTAVGYQDGQAGVQTTASTTISGSSSKVWTQFDYNGDGIRDLAYYNGSTWYVAFGSVNGLTTAVNTGITGSNAVSGDVYGIGKDSIVSVVSGTWYGYTWNGSAFAGVSTGISTSTSATAIGLSDVDGDGRADMLYVTSFYSNGYTISTRANTSSGGTPSFGAAVSQALADPLATNMITSVALYGPGDQPSGPRRLNFNGDGREDYGIVVGYSYCYYDPYVGPICSNFGAFDELISQSGYQYSISVAGGLGGPSGGLAKFGNWNSDACTDVFANGGWAISGCNGSSPVTISLTATGAADWNADGLSDAVYVNASTGNLSVQLSTGTGAGAIINTSIPCSAGAPFTIDVDGDGLDDMGCWSPGIGITIYRHNSPGVTPDLATSFTDGFGVNASPSYTTVARGLGSVAIQATDATFPNVNYSGTLDVVSAVTATDASGNASTYSQSFFYFSPWLNLQGRGFLGFDTKRTIDSRNGQVQYESYRRDFPYTGAVYAAYLYQQDGSTPIRQQNNTLTYQTLDGTANNQRYFPYANQVTKNDWEVGGAKNGQLITSESTSLTYDSFGNATSVATTTTDQDSGSPYYGANWTSTTAVSVSPDSSSNWCLGRPTQVQVTRSAPATTAVTRTVSYSVDYANCRPTQQIVEPSSGTYKVTTAWGYDSFGNVSSETVTGIGMAARSTSASFGTTGQFPVSSTNALGQITQYGYNYNLGLRASLTTPNSGANTTSWSYDAFARLAQETQPDGTFKTIAHASVATGTDPRNVYKLNVYEYASDSSYIRGTAIYMDRYDRAIDRYTYTFTGSGYIANVRAFDSLGRLAWEGMPFQASSGYQYTPAYATSYTYDAANRVTQVSRPTSASNSTPAVTTVAYAGRTQTITDPQGKQTSKVITVIGALGRTTDHNGYYQALTYDGFSSLVQVVDSLGSTLFQANYAYGLGAFQTSLTDMDLGARTSTYDALGEVTAYTDAKSQSFSVTYDALSRPLTRVEPDQTTTWTWGSAAGSYNIGQLQSVAVSGYSESYVYDSASRLATRTIVADQSYAFDYAYNNQGLLDTLTFPTSTSSTRVKLKYGYPAGQLTSVTDYTTGSPGTVYWQATGVGPWGQVSTETLGNGVITNRALDAVTGWQSSIQAGVGGGAGIQNQSYLYDPVGNVTQRQDNNLGLTENFYYDNLYRLSYSQLGGSTNLSLAYDAMGNITSRSDVNSGATWTYDTVKKHAVRSAGGSNAYTYDANGNMITRNGTSLGWTSYNYPSQVATSTESASFYYTPDRQYYKQVYTGPSGTETTFYIGGVLEKVTLPGGTTDWRHYVNAGSEPVAIISRLSTGTNTVRYTLEDHQGSSSVLVDGSGAVLVKESFGAYGTARNAATWSGAVPAGDKSTINSISRRGYTFHSMLGDMGLIHMNGRVQDSITGRFLSADTNIPDPEFTQSYNRYSYVNNNPMSRIDPSGFADEEKRGQPATQGKDPLEEVQVTAHRIRDTIQDQIAGAKSRAGELYALAQSNYQEYRRLMDAGMQADIASRQAQLDVQKAALENAAKYTAEHPVEVAVLVATTVVAPERLLLDAGKLLVPAARGAASLVRGGASLENITTQQALRIQNAANRAGTEISLVGSRARGTANAASDWDYVIDGSARLRNSLSGSLPGARSVAEGVPRNLDIFRGPLDPNLPSITFFPLKP